MITSRDARFTFLASGPSGTFRFPRPVRDGSALGVVALATSGVEYHPPYAVNVLPDESGADVAIPAGLAEGDKVVVYRVMRRVQTQPLNMSGPWQPAVVDRILDRLTADIQAAAILLERALGVSMADDPVVGNVPSASERALKVLGFDHQGRPTVLSNVPLDPAVAVSAFMQTLLQNATALDVLADLGFSSFAASLRDDADAPAYLASLGFSDFFRSLVSVTDAASLRSQIEVANLASAFVDNGACQVAQVPDAVNLSTTPQHSPVDRFSGWASGGAVSAGSMQHHTSSAIGRAGYSLKFGGISLTGSGELAMRYRIDTAVARRLRNASVSFACQVVHDVGSSVNYTVHVRKPTVADNFASTTLIQSSVAQSVPSGVSTRVTFENVALGDVTNGLEVEVRVACGAITSKNFEFTEVVLAEAVTAPAFQNLNTYAANLAACQRHLRLKSSGREVWSGDVTIGTWYWHSVRFDAPMRAGPTMTLADVGVNAGFNSGYPPTVNVVDAAGFDVAKQSASTATGAYYTYTWRADARLAP